MTGFAQLYRPSTFSLRNTIYSTVKLKIWTSWIRKRTNSMMFCPYTPWLPESLSSNTQMIKKRNLDKLDNKRTKSREFRPYHRISPFTHFTYEEKKLHNNLNKLDPTATHQLLGLPFTERISFSGWRTDDTSSLADVQQPAGPLAPEAKSMTCSCHCLPRGQRLIGSWGKKL